MQYEMKKNAKQNRIQQIQDFKSGTQNGYRDRIDKTLKEANDVKKQSDELEKLEAQLMSRLQTTYQTEKLEQNKLNTLKTSGFNKT